MRWAALLFLFFFYCNLVNKERELGVRYRFLLMLLMIGLDCKNLHVNWHGGFDSIWWIWWISSIYKIVGDGQFIWKSGNYKLRLPRKFLSLSLIIQSLRVFIWELDHRRENVKDPDIIVRSGLAKFLLFWSEMWCRPRQPHSHKEKEPQEYHS